MLEAINDGHVPGPDLRHGDEGKLVGHHVDLGEQEVAEGDEHVEEGQQHWVHVVLPTELLRGGKNVKKETVFQDGDLNFVINRIFLYFNHNFLFV